MSCRSTALSVFLLLFDLTHARSVSFLPGFELPEVDGSAVDICRIFFDPTPDTIMTTSITMTTTTTPITTTTTPITKKQVVATTTITTTTKKPAVQSPPKKPETKNAGTPVRPQPISDSLLYYLLANSRGHAAGSLPGLNSFISQPIGRLPQRGYGMTSDSDESAATLPKSAGRTNDNRWKIGSSSSEDSSDES